MIEAESRMRLRPSARRPSRPRMRSVPPEWRGRRSIRLRTYHATPPALESEADELVVSKEARLTHHTDRKN